MDVQMGNSFTTIRAIIDDHTVTGTSKALLSGCRGRSGNQCSEKRSVGSGGLIESGDAALGDDKKVNRGLWSDIAEGDPVGTLRDDLGGDFPGSDFLEQGHALR
jgi:hypothetical protein